LGKFCAARSCNTYPRGSCHSRFSLKACWPPHNLHNTSAVTAWRYLFSLPACGAPATSAGDALVALPLPRLLLLPPVPAAAACCLAGAAECGAAAPQTQACTQQQQQQQHSGNNSTAAAPHTQA
jgi:hypothetical protein